MEAWGWLYEVSGTEGWAAWLDVLATVSCQRSGIMFAFSIFFFSARFSETVESKCLGIWAAVNDNK